MSIVPLFSDPHGVNVFVSRRDPAHELEDPGIHIALADAGKIVPAASAV